MMPSYLQIGPYRYRVVMSEEAINFLSAKESARLYGHCDPERLTITVRSKIPRDVARETLLHESLHALLDLVGVAAELEDDQEESLVRRLAPALVRFALDNPEVWADVIAE